MRTFAEALADFRKLVEERGCRLRAIPFSELLKLKDAQTEHITFDNRPTTVSVIVQLRPSGEIRVVVQGFMSARWFFGQNVALDGFYKSPDETVTPMPNKEFYEFD